MDSKDIVPINTLQLYHWTVQFILFCSIYSQNLNLLSLHAGWTPDAPDSMFRPATKCCIVEGSECECGR